MPSRDQRDEYIAETEGEGAPPQPEAAPPEFPQGQLQLSPSQQHAAVETVLADFTAAKAARDTRKYGYGAKGDQLKFDSWMQELKDLYYGHREPKTEPWKFCSNRSMMIAMAIVETLHARIFPAVYNEELTRWRPAEITDAPKAETVEKFMYWWIRVRSRCREFFDRWTRYVIWGGTAVTETLWDVRYRYKGASPQQPVQPGMEAPPTEPQLIPFEKTRSDLYAWEDVFLQEGASDPELDPVILRMRYFYRDLEDMERKGQAINVTTPTDPQASPLKDRLPVLAPTDSNLDDAAKEELMAVKRRNLPVEVLKWHGNVDFDGDGYPEPVVLLVNETYRIYLGGVSIADLSYRGTRHLDITQFTPRVDEPNGLWGLGVMEMIKQHALEIDAIFNQMTDANSLSVLMPGFYDPSGNLDAQALRMKPGVLHPVTNPQASIYFPTINVQTEKLINAVRLVLEFIERLTAASAYIMGKESEIVGGSGTATRTNEIVSASNTRHSIPMARLRDGAARIITHHLDLVQKHIDEMPGIENRVLGDNHQPVFASNDLVKDGLAAEMDAYLLPDESMGSHEVERQLAQMLYQILLPNLIVASDPAKIYKVTADFLKSYGKDPVAYLGPEPPIAGATSPADEHTMILQGDYKSLAVNPTQNPIEHLIAHMNFANDPRLAQLTPILQEEIKTALTAHIQQHVQMMQLIQAASAAAPPPGQQQQPGGPNGKPGGRGSPGTAGPGAAPVGPEQGVGAVSPTASKTSSSQKRGESLSP